jgi:hypothetical protein
VANHDRTGDESRRRLQLLGSHNSHHDVPRFALTKNSR